MEVLKKNDILGVRVDNLSRSEILEKIGNFLDESRFHQIATINPEFILEAEKNTEFRNVLNSSDLNVADGFGVRLAFLRYGKWLRSRMAGVDLAMEILRLASGRGLGIYIAARKDGLSSYEEIKKAILNIYPKLKIGGKDFNVKNVTTTSIQPYMEAINKSMFADGNILFCNLGAPQQEFFINSLKSENSAKIRLAMGVGGSFDFLTGKIQRAPIFLRQIGLEWLWRFFQEPCYRWKRIFRAVIIFPIKVIFSK